MTHEPHAIELRGIPPCPECELLVCVCFARSGPLGVYVCPEWHPSHPGPWADEPDLVGFRAYGQLCVVSRGGRDAWCGYVPVPPWHPAHGADIHALEPLRVHGGVTWADPMPRLVGRSDALLVVPSDWWWIGFDCGHGFDGTPQGWAWERSLSDPPPYRPVGYAMAETAALACQLAALA